MVTKNRSRRGLLWRFLACLALMPLVINLGGAPAAQAAADEGASNWASARWEVKGVGVSGLTIFDLDCTAALGATTVDGGLNLRVESGECLGSRDLTPWSCQRGEPGCSQVELTFTGPACDGIRVPTIVDAGNRDGLAHTHIIFTGTGFIGSCKPAAACLNILTNDGAENVAAECEPIDLELPDDEPIDMSCDAGAPHKVSFTQPRAAGDYAWTYDGKWSWLKGSGAYPQVRMGMVMRQRATKELQIWGYTPGNAGVSYYANMSANAHSWFNGSGSSGERPYVIGPQSYFDAVGVIIAVGAAPNTWRDFRVQGANAIGSTGVTKPSACLWYFGEQIRSPGSINDPGGDATGTPGKLDGGGGTTPPLGDPPPRGTDTDEDKPLFEIDWLEGIWGLLKDLLDLLGGIVGAILDGLKALFIPDIGSWDLDSVFDQWEARPPGSIITGLGETLKGFESSLSATGGCNLPNFFPGSQAQLTCPGSSTAYAGAYAVVKYSIIAATGFYVFHIARGAIAKGGD